MIPARSLKLSLVVDLSLLTATAILLSTGLAVILFRMQFPSQLEDVSQRYLQHMHESFIHSSEFEPLAKSPLWSGSSDRALNDALKSAFQKFQGRFEKGGDDKANAAALEFLRVEREGGPSNSLVPVSKKFLFVFPTVSEFQFTGNFGDTKSFIYSWSMEPMHALVDRVKYLSLLAALLIEVFLILLGYFLLFRRNVLLPIQQLSVVSKAFLEENWSVRYAVDRRDELGRVGEALNEMAKKIQEKEKKLVLTIESLKKANEEVEIAQNEQLQIEKLASIGRLAAGVAHEVGNPLGAISGYVDILRRALKNNPTATTSEDVELCDRIEAETGRISRIIRALLQQARPTEDRIRSLKLKPILVRSLQLAQVPPVIDVQFDFEDDEAEALAEEDQLVQVFLNLVVNAKHAIESKKDKSQTGWLKIRCVMRKLPVYRGAGDSGDLDTSVVRALKPEVYWVVSIEDNGTGIKEDDQKKLFEPFFSTKAPGKGTGLGLYVTKSIVESFRGAIVVRSAFGYGTSFSVFLPKGR